MRTRIGNDQFIAVSTFRIVIQFCHVSRCTVISGRHFVKIESVNFICPVKFNELSHGGFNFGNWASLLNSANVSDSLETKLGVLF